MNFLKRDETAISEEEDEWKHGILESQETAISAGPSDAVQALDSETSGLRSIEDEDEDSRIEEV